MITQSPGPDQPLEEQLALLLRSLRRTVVRFAARGEEQLPEAQVEVLHALAARGPLSPTQIAEALQLARPTVSNLVRIMTDRGLIARWRSDTDGRAVLLSITTDAERLMASVQRRRVGALARALTQLPDSAREQLSAAMPALAQLQQALEALADDAPASETVASGSQEQ